MQLYLTILLEWVLLVPILSTKTSESRLSSEEYDTILSKSAEMEQSAYEKSLEDYPTSDEKIMTQKLLHPKKFVKIKILKTEELKLASTEPTTTPSVAIEDQTLKSVNENSCNELETPLNVGRYKLPTTRDMLLLKKKNMIKYFNTYQKKASVFLQDMKLATTALMKNVPFCSGLKRQWYEKCTTHVKSMSDTITKNTLVNLDKKKHEISLYTSDKNCNDTLVTGKSLDMLKWLAVENLSLDFGMPAFLRIMYVCADHCKKNGNPRKKKFSRDEKVYNLKSAANDYLKEEH